MASSDANALFAALIVAAGKGERAGQAMPKQFAPHRGKPLLRHSVEAMASAGADPIVLVIPEGADDLARDAIGPLPARLVTGRATRQGSVLAGLEALSSPAQPFVLVHDAARPDLPPEVIGRLLAALSDHDGAVPVLPLVDSIALAEGAVMASRVDRDRLRRVQTPQAFRYAQILAAYRAWQGELNASDDAQVALAARLTVALVKGDERLAKLTYPSDFTGTTAPAVRIGQGFDVHRLVPGAELWLGGVLVPHDYGLSGHSDADVLLHAITDAVLGALGEGDIGTHFPPSDPRWKGARSSLFVEHAARLAQDAGYEISNLDTTLICEAPRIGPHRERMQKSVAALLATQPSRVSIKATTTERLGFTGRGEGIAASAIVTLALRS